MPSVTRLLTILAALVASASLVPGSTDAVGVAAQRDDVVDIVPQGVDGLRPGAAAAIVDRVGARAWHDAGYIGEGVTIGLIDHLDVRYWDPALGPAPTPADVVCLADGADCTSEFFDGIDQGGDRHGPAVAAVLRTIAPGARLVYGRARTLADYRQLVDRFAALGVTIVNRSLGSRYDGPGDGRGGLDEVVDHAVSLGMLWVNSGGNNGDGKYHRAPVAVRDGWVDFGGSRYLEFRGTAQLAGVRWPADWDLPPHERTDYDVHLYRAPAGNPAAGTEIARSALRQRDGAPPLETIAGRYTAGPGERLYLAVRHRGGDTRNDVLEVLDYGDGFVGAATTVAGSAAVPAVDSASPGAVSVGAIDPPDGRAVASYSAQGPTTDGRVVPTLTAPTGYANVVSGGFSGTSAAAAVVSGAAALLAGAGVATTPADLATALRSEAIDHGPPGPDHAYGWGEVRLPAPPSGSLASPRGAARFVPVTPHRLLDTRRDGGPLAPGTTREVAVAGIATVPEAATAVAVNVTSVDGAGAGYLQLLPTGRARVGAFSNVNTDGPGQIRANFAVVPIGDRGTIGVHASGGGDVVLDVLGYFVPVHGPVAAGRWVGLGTPLRVLDTRDGDAGPLRTGDRRHVPFPEAVDPVEASALVVTVTATGATQPGWVQAYPTGRDDLVGATSTLNVDAGETVANLAVVPIGAGGISVAARLADGGATHVVVDVVGYVTSAAAPVVTAGRFVAVTPARAFDSRADGGPLGDRGAVTVRAGVPADASGVVWNTTVVAAERAGYARVWSGAQPEPATSSLNWSRAGETRAAASVGTLEGGAGAFVVDDGSANRPGPLGHLVVDVFGYLTS